MQSLVTRTNSEKTPTLGALFFAMSFECFATELPEAPGVEAGKTDPIGVGRIISSIFIFISFIFYR